MPLPREPGQHTEPPVILFDGVCNLCNGAVNWVLARDTRKHFVFASLQSDVAMARLAAHTTDMHRPDSIAVIDADGVHWRSEAALRIAAQLGFPWRLLTVGRLLPRPVRDALYSWIARNRYRWFGKRDTCMIPAPGVADRFLD